MRTVCSNDSTLTAKSLILDSLQVPAMPPTDAGAPTDHRCLIGPAAAEHTAAGSGPSTVPGAGPRPDDQLDVVIGNGRAALAATGRTAPARSGRGHGTDRFASAWSGPPS